MLGGHCKTWPMASNEACALVSGTPDKFLTHFCKVVVVIVVVDAVVEAYPCASIFVWVELLL